jgi:hypothetical protein
MSKQKQEFFSTILSVARFDRRSGIAVAIAVYSIGDEQPCAGELLLVSIRRSCHPLFKLVMVAACHVTLTLANKDL